MNAPVVPPPAASVVSPGQPTRKVTFASLGAYLAGVAGLAVVNAVGGHIDVLSAALPSWANMVLTPVVPGLIAFVTGYITKHAPNDVLLATTPPKR